MSSILEKIVCERDSFRFQYGILPTTIYIGMVEMSELVILINANSVDKKFPTPNEIKKWKVAGMRIYYIKEKARYFKVTI